VPLVIAGECRSKASLFTTRLGAGLELLQLNDESGKTFQNWLRAFADEPSQTEFRQISQGNSGLLRQIECLLVG
jgi:hypothetical protein